MGPNVTNIQPYPTQDIKNVYCFASNISKININIKGKGENFYIIDKTNIPEVFSTLNVTFHNLAEISDLESGGEYEYGSSAIPFLTPSITNNVEGMRAEVNIDNLSLNAGFYNSGLPIVFSNDIPFSSSFDTLIPKRSDVLILLISSSARSVLKFKFILFTS